MRHSEFHRSHRIGWLRAAVLGANDGIVSTASLIIGVAAAHATQDTILLTGVAGLVSGAMSMAAGEYVSVSSQADTENADLAREREELATQPEHELDELTGIYIGRGLTPELAKQVAVQLTVHDALAAHARDELGIIEAMNARPVQAALASAGTFALGAALPLLVAFVASSANTVPYVAGMSLAFLALLGG
ncbi:MAG: VIT family protein, partial [Methylotenera sp.]